MVGWGGLPYPLPLLHEALGDALQGVALDLGVVVLDQAHGTVLGTQQLHDAIIIQEGDERGQGRAGYHAGG